MHLLHVLLICVKILKYVYLERKRDNILKANLQENKVQLLKKKSQEIIFPIILFFLITD